MTTKISYEICTHQINFLVKVKKDFFQIYNSIIPFEFPIEELALCGF